MIGQENHWTDRYLLCGHLVDPKTAEARQKFEATARFIRDLVAHRWVKTRQAREDASPKRIHYLSMEFLLGRTLRNNMMNLAADSLVRQALDQAGWNLEKLIEEEPDAGLGNGGLGRLAACFIDSLATLQYPAIGYGLRYEYGIFRQEIRDGCAIRAARQLAPQSRSVGDRTARESLRRAAEFDFRVARLDDPLEAESALQSGRDRLRSAGRGLRRAMHQHFAAMGGRGPEHLRLR